MKVFLPVWALVFLLACHLSFPMPVLRFTGLFLAGLTIWSITEYLAHRFLFHLNLQSSAGRKLIFIIHGNHHDDPADAQRNMMPLSVTIPIAALLWLIASFLDGHDGRAVFTGFLAGYILYDLIHYACHQYPMRQWPLNLLRRHHLVHHFAAPETNFGVSSSVWDHIVGTKLRKRR
ncbi:sterol desaturase family protein [Gluconobacter morbifer]|nr:sterol desaturase family protein [Gluconobacter morbifer]